MAKKDAETVKEKHNVQTVAIEHRMVVRVKTLAHKKAPKDFVKLVIVRF